MTMTNTLTKIMAKTIDDAGCLVWQGGLNNGHPTARINGVQTQIRRAVWESEHGPIPSGHVIHNTCGTPSCISIECMTMVTRQQINKINGEKGLSSGIARAAAIARVKRNGPQAKLTNEDVADIRASAESQRTLAKRFGVSQTHISNVQRHQARRNFVNPFQGLGARA